MMLSEFIGAWKEADGDNHLVITHNMWAAITACYHGRRLNDLVCGSGRHLIFAKWMRRNMRTVQRLRQMKAMHSIRRRSDLLKQKMAIQTEIDSLEDGVLHRFSDVNHG